MRGFKVFFCWIIIFSFSVFSCSCSRVRVSPNEAIGELLAAHSLPSGVVYSLEAAEAGASEKEMLVRAFGASESELEGVRSFALYLSARETVCEAAVFECYSKSEARELAAICLARGELLSRYEKEITSKVVVKGKHLLWAVCEDPDTLIATLCRAVM